MYDVNSPFDMEKHKETYVNYLEAIIRKDGTIEYAVPSHQEKLISIACKMYGLTREELSLKCPGAFFADFNLWLCGITESVAIWTEGYMCFDMSKAQESTVNALMEEGLLKDYCFSKPNEYLRNAFKPLKKGQKQLEK